MHSHNHNLNLWTFDWKIGMLVIPVMKNIYIKFCFLTFFRIRNGCPYWADERTHRRARPVGLLRPIKTVTQNKSTCVGSSFWPFWSRFVHRWLFRSVQSSIGHIFLIHEPKIQMYERYIKASPRSAMTIQTWIKKDADFSKLIKLFQVIRLSSNNYPSLVLSSVIA